MKQIISLSIVSIAFHTAEMRRMNRALKCLFVSVHVWIYSYFWECVLLIIMLKWGIFNASVLLNEHGHPPFLFLILSSYLINVQWTKFERKSIVTFILEELPSPVIGRQGGRVWSQVSRNWMMSGGAARFGQCENVVSKLLWTADCRLQTKGKMQTANWG